MNRGLCACTLSKGLFLCVCISSILLFAYSPSVGAQEYYFIKVKNSGKCLHQHGGTYGNGDPITQWDCVDEPNVQWIFVPTSAPPPPPPPPSTGTLLVSLGFGAGYPGCTYACQGSGTVTVSSATGSTHSQRYSYSGTCSSTSPACSTHVTFSQLQPGLWNIQDSVSGANCQKQVTAGQFTTVTIREDRTCQ